MQKNSINVKIISVLALLAALGAVFSAFVSIEIAPSGFKTVEISLAPVPVMLAGMFFGPLAGGLVGCVTDIAGFFMGVQHGAYNPFFTLTMALFGVIAGLFYQRSQKNTILKVTALAALTQLVISVTLNTLAIWLFYHVPIAVLLPTRAVSALIETPVYAWLLMVLAESLRPVVTRFAKTVRTAS